MGNEDVDLVTVAKSSNKKTLLERYNIPIEHLSYEYVSECTKVKELERIILILRSGEEGSYPDLTRHTEERLTTIKPDSTVLRKATPVITRNSLAPERRKILDNDMNEWMNEMKLREKDLEEGRNMQIKEPIPQPDIREITVDQHKKKHKSSQNPDKSKRISSFDYAAWDKYDADTELDRIDLKHEQKQAEMKRNQQKLREKEEKVKKSSRESIVNKLTLTGTEYNVMAEEERKKGNEAFKAGDYDEALQFYNLSIAIDAMPQAYNNRAITFIKLRRYNDAVNDCNRVISVEHNNIKALLRRGLALEHMEKNSQALADYEAVLKMEPTNKIAIVAVNKLRGPCNSRKIKMRIEEESPETTSSTVVKIIANDNCRPINSKFGQEKTHKMSHTVESEKIANKSKPSLRRSSPESVPQIIPKLCFCNNAPSSSQQTSPLPHMQDIYCSGTRGNKSQKLPKLQSIFTDTKKSYEKSSRVIIEEIPNEPYEKLSGLIIEEIPNEPYEKSVDKSSAEKNDDKSVKIKKINATLGSGDNSENIVKSVGKLIEEIPAKEVDSKEDIPAKKFDRKEDIPAKEIDRKEGITVMKVDSKDKMMKDTKFNKISSPYEFLKLWHSFKNDSELVLRTRLLLNLPPEDIDTVIGNKMDGDMFSIIIRCFEKYLCVPEHSILLHSFLHSLTRVKRFSLICMFMNEKDKRVLRAVLTFLEVQVPEGIQYLRKAYNLSM